MALPTAMTVAVGFATNSNSSKSLRVPEGKLILL